MMATTQIKGKADLARLRRFALDAQGLTRNAPFGRGISGARKAIAHLGYVQIDTISVVERAHHHVVHSRIPNFKPGMINRLLKDGSIFEYWAHAAAFLPMRDYRFSLPYKQMMRDGTAPWPRSNDTKLMRELYRRIETEGPLRSRDLEDTRISKAGWWDWKPAKRAMEQLWMQGDLMVCARDGFEKTYDLTERVLPDHIDTRPPSYAEFAEHVLDQQLRCHAFASQKGITYLRRDAELRKAVKAELTARLQRGALDELVLPGGERFYCERGLLDRAAPRTSRQLRILSPFDNAVIQRERLDALFGFDYQIECYVPEAKRQYGYFCLPLLLQDHFVGRMDCKAHRDQGRLELKSVHLCDSAFDTVEIVNSLAEALPQFAQFQGCDAITVTATDPPDMLQSLRAAIEQTQ